MGADLITTTWKTPEHIDRKSILTVAQFRKKVTTIVNGLPLSTFDEWTDDYHYGLFDGIPTDDEMAEMDAADVKEAFREGRGYVVSALTNGYEILRDTVTGGMRYADYSKIGSVLVWTAGGTSWGDEPFDGWSDLCGIIGIGHYAPEIAALIPWLLSGNQNWEQYTDTDRPEAVGVPTRYARTILAHVAMTHPDADVRVSVIADPHLHLTVDELKVLAGNEVEAVRQAATKRIVAASKA